MPLFIVLCTIRQVWSVPKCSQAGGSRLTPILPSIPKDYIDNMLNSNMSESDMDTLMNSVETTNVGVGGNNLTGVDKTARWVGCSVCEPFGSCI